MIPDSDALDQLHHHLAQWRQGAGSLTEDDINSSGGADSDPLDVDSLRRGRAAAQFNAKPQPAGQSPAPTMGAAALGPIEPPPQPRNESSPGGPSRLGGAIAATVMGAKPAAPVVDTSKPLGAPRDTELEALQAKTASDKRWGKVGQAVTAFTEQQDPLTSYFQQRAGAKPTPMAHNSTWDNAGSEGDQAIKDLEARRASSASMAASREKNDPRSSTAETYRSIIYRLSPGLKGQLDNATPAQMEKIFAPVESLAKNETELAKESGKKDPSAKDAAELASFKQVMAGRYPEHAAEIAGLTTMKGAQDFQNAYEGDKTRSSNEKIAAGVRSTARGEHVADKTDEVARKAAEVEAEQSIPGLKHDAGVKNDKQEVGNIRSARAEAETMRGLIADLDKDIVANGLKILPSEAKTRMQSTLRQLQLKAKGKAFAELGVLSGPDLAILEELTGDPTDWKTSFKGGAEGVRERLRVFQKVLDSGISNASKLHGYSPAIAATNHGAVTFEGDGLREYADGFVEEIR